VKRLALQFYEHVFIRSRVSSAFIVIHTHLYQPGGQLVNILPLMVHPGSLRKDTAKKARVSQESMIT
jgi:hypothetical protein